MSSIAIELQEAPQKRWLFWTGWVVSLWPVFVVASSATWKLTRNAWYVAEFARIGWPESALNLLAFLQLGCIVLFLIPRTSVLGAILLTGYLGGAVATHLRVHDPLFDTLFPVIFGVLVWGGLYWRDPRLGALIPLTKPRP